MARSLRSKRLQKNRGVKRKKYAEREKKRMWEKAEKMKEKEEATKPSDMESAQQQGDSTEQEGVGTGTTYLFVVGICTHVLELVLACMHSIYNIYIYIYNASCSPRNILCCSISFLITGTPHCLFINL